MNEIIIPWIIHCRFLINFSMNLIAIRKKIFFSIRCKHPLIEFLRHPVERGCGQPFSPTESLSLHRRKADCELLGSQLNESCGIVSRYSRITQFLWLLLNLSFIPGKRDRWESGERRNDVVYERGGFITRARGIILECWSYSVCFAIRCRFNDGRRIGRRQWGTTFIVLKSI